MRCRTPCRWCRAAGSGSLQGPPRGGPRASRRRGPGEDSTARRPVARRFAHTHGEYQTWPGWVVVGEDTTGRGDHGPGRRRGPRNRSPSGGRAPVRGLTLLNGPAYHPRDDERAGALTGAGRVCVPSGVGTERARGRRRGSTDSPYGQADVPAQEATSRQGARLPRPDEDPGWSPHPGRSAGPGAKAPVGLTARRDATTSRLVMLSRPGDFALIGDRGTSRSHPLLTARFLRTDLDVTRFGLSTGRRLGGAVTRNRVRRRLREALRVMAPSFQPGWDVLIIARPAIVSADHDALVGALRRLLARGGVIGGSNAT